jgi:hypothetical protein
MSTSYSTPLPAVQRADICLIHIAANAGPRLGLG